MFKNTPSTHFCSSDSCSQFIKNLKNNATALTCYLIADASTSGSTSSSSTSVSGGTVGKRKPATHNFRPRNPHEHHSGPFFEEPLDGSNHGEQMLLSAHLFTEAVLNCRVGMLHDKTVSIIWDE